MPTISEFESESLSDLAAAFRARSKAVSYLTSSWSISREQADDESERMNVDAKHFHDDIRLSVWADRVVWFRLCRGPAKNGWKFMLSFDGDATSVTDAEIVEQFVASCSRGACNSLLAIWSNVSPNVERSEPTT